MKIPKRFTIKGKTWEVSYRKLPDPNDDTCDGLCVFERRKILLRRGLNDEARTSAFLHEMVHACLYEAHLRPDAGLKTEAEEIVCDAVADMMLTCFKLTWRRAKR